MFLRGWALTWKLPASPWGQPRATCSFSRLCPVGHRLHDRHVTRYSVPPTAPSPPPLMSHRISGERDTHFVNCYQKREVSIMSFSDTFAFCQSFSRPHSWAFCEILRGKKRMAWGKITDVLDVILPIRRRWKLELDTVNKSQKCKPVWTPGGQLRSFCVSSTGSPRGWRIPAPICTLSCLSV